MGDCLPNRRRKSQAGKPACRVVGRFQRLAGIFQSGRGIPGGGLNVCTLTFVPTEDGYVAGMNRDEKLARPRAIPPKRFDFPGATALFPRESSGGTWIGCNSHGNLLALLNWNDVEPRFDGVNLQSRGVLIPELIGGEDLADTHARFTQVDLNGVLPFRLIGAFPGESVITEWRWDGLHRQEFRFAWRKRHWFSSSISDALAQRERGRA